MKVAFWKMNGLGNEIVVIDARAGGMTLDADAARLIASPATGPGCDQIMVIGPPPPFGEASGEASGKGRDGADISTAIWNMSGEEVEACGNGARCVAAWLFREEGVTRVTMATKGGLIEARDAGNGCIAIDMGVPRFGWQDIPLAEEIHDTRAIELQIGPIDAPILHSPSAVNVGNPHAIFWVDEPDAFNLEKIGPLIENHPMFPARANISLAKVVDRTTIRARVWERGAGATRACGTAACAMAVAAARKGLTERAVTVHLPGGALEIVWRETDDHIVMTGPAEFEFAGEIDLAPEGAPA